MQTKITKNIIKLKLFSKIIIIIIEPGSFESENYVRVT